jgi:hypothetical protein
MAAIEDENGICPADVSISRWPDDVARNAKGKFCGAPQVNEGGGKCNLN